MDPTNKYKKKATTQKYIYVLLIINNKTSLMFNRIDIQLMSDFQLHYIRITLYK